MSEVKKLTPAADPLAAMHGCYENPQHTREGFTSTPAHIIPLVSGMGVELQGIEPMTEPMTVLGFNQPLGKY